MCIRDRLKLAAEQRQDDEKVVLVVDALDEAGTPMGENVLLSLIHISEPTRPY